MCNCFSFCLGSTDQFEEILSLYEELKVTKWVLIWLTCYMNSAVCLTLQGTFQSLTLLQENQITKKRKLEKWAEKCFFYIILQSLFSSVPSFCVFGSELSDAARKALISRVVELTDDRAALQLELTSLQESVSRLEGRLKEKEEETKRCERLCIMYFHIWVLVIWAKCFISAVFHRLRKDLEACQSEDPDVRRNYLRLHLLYHV